MGQEATGLDRSDRVFIVLLLIALAAAVYLAVGRMQIERGNRIVEIIVDADDVRRVAAASGTSAPDLLAELRGAGATALGVREMKLEEMVEAGWLLTVPDTRGAALVASDGETAARLAAAIKAKFPASGAQARGIIVSSQRSGDPALQRGMAGFGDSALQLGVLRDVPLLLRPEDLTAAGEAGLRVVARLGNFPGATPAAIESAAATAERAGARLVIFRDDQVLGYQSLIGETAKAFEKHGLLFGNVEMAQQKGQEGLAKLLVDRLVRVHSITDADLETITANTAITRYARAVRERNIRACYVRLMVRPLADPKAANLAYVAAVVQALRKEGFRTGPPAPFSAPAGWPSRPAKLLVLLGLGAGVALLLGRLAPVGAGGKWLAFAVVTGPLLLLALAGSAKAAALGGLLAASVFPALGLTAALQEAHDHAAGRPGAGQVVRRGLVGLGLASLLSLVGGMLIVGLYAELRYLVGAGLFTGVKASYLLPLAVVLLVVIADLSGKAEPMAAWKERVGKGLAGAFRSPITWGQAVALVVALGAVGIVLMRSGNESAVAPSGLELKMRNLLEALLIARPRTKEFLIGHPALMLACALVLMNRRTWLPLVALVAVVGQVSLLNTFCHFHMPLYLGLLRSAHGVWIGALIGTGLALVWRACWDRSSEAESR